MSPCFLLIGILLGPPVPDQLSDTEAVPVAHEEATEIEAAFGHEWLSGDMPDWNTAAVELLHRVGRDGILDAIIRHSRRYAQQDVDAAVGYSTALNQDWRASWELEASPTSRISPQWSVQAGLHRDLHHGWLIGAGGRWSAYDEVDVARLILSVERYWGSIRSAYSLSMNTLWGDKVVGSHQLALNVYYHERNSVGFIYAAGTELEKVSSSVVSNSIDALVAVGRHWCTDRWAISYECGWNRVGSHHSRTGIRLGLRYQL